MDSRINRMLAGIALWLAWQSGHAQSIYKCKDAAGQSLYQSAPCADGPEEKRWDTQQRSVSRDDQQKRITADAKVESDRRALRRSNAANARTPARGGSAGSAIPAQTSACKRARAQREKALARMGLKRTFDAIRALDAMVWDACKIVGAMSYNDDSPPTTRIDV